MDGKPKMTLAWTGQTYVDGEGMGHIDQVMACPCCGQPIQVKVEVDSRYVQMAGVNFESWLDDSVWIEIAPFCRDKAKAKEVGG